MNLKLETIQETIFSDDRLKKLVTDTDDDNYDIENQINEFIPHIYSCLEKVIVPLSLNDTFYEILDDIIIQITQETLVSKSFIQRRYYEILLDSVKYFLEEKILSSYEDDNFRYPDFDDIDFNKKIFLKKEFNKLRYGDELLKTQAKIKNFRPSSTQTFVKQYLSPNTPYNGLLVWHGVGVGKTCSAILAAEEYKDYLNKLGKKIIILLPSTQTLEKTWKEEIFNFEKEANKPKDIDNLQCTGTIYTKLYNKYKINEDLTDEQIKRKINRHIKEYYEFYGYQKFSNDILKVINGIHKKKNKTRQELIIEYIKERFSTCFFIIDEAHGIRPNESTPKLSDEGSDGKDKDINFVMNLITRYAEDCKIMLLSATPMFDKSDEIIDLVNILLQNDKRAPILQNKIFDKGNNFTSEGKDIFIRKTRGYVSYARGENIHTFPLRLYPDDEKTFTPNPSKDYNGKPINYRGEAINNSVLFYRGVFSQAHYNYYNSAKSLKGSFGYQNSLESSTIIFPFGEKNFNHGNDGFKGCINKRGLLRYNFKENGYINGKPFLHMDNLINFSPKIYNILKCIEQSKGIVFIYSNRVEGGVISIAIALQLLGYDNYLGEGRISPIIEDVEGFKKPKSKGKFIVLYGDINNADKLRQEVNGLSSYGKNDNGEHIKIILGTDTVQQGISFLGVREIHILEPWHNISKLDQAVGRGFRNKSHMKLPENKRNLTVYYHINSSENGEHETIDEYMYRKAFEKDRNISKIARLLKQNAVDCNLNKEGNTSQENLEGFQINSRDNEIDVSKLILYEDNNRSCDYDICNYVCESNISDGQGDIDNTTFNLEILNYNNIDVCIDLIKYLFYDNLIIRLDILKHKIYSIDNTVTDEEIYFALDRMLKEEIEIIYKYGKNKYKGYIIYTGGYYIFNALDIKENASLNQKFVLPSQKNENIKLKFAKPVSFINNSATRIKGSKMTTEDKNVFKDFLKIYIRETLETNMSKKKMKDPVYLIQTEPIYLTLSEDFNYNLLRLGELFYKIDSYDFDTKKTLISSSLSYILENGLDTDYSQKIFIGLQNNNFNIINDIFTDTNLDLSIAKIIQLFYGKLYDKSQGHSIFWDKQDFINDRYKVIFRLFNNQDKNYNYFAFNSNNDLIELGNTDTIVIQLNNINLSNNFDDDDIQRMIYLFFYRKDLEYFNFNKERKTNVGSDTRLHMKGTKFSNIAAKNLEYIIKILFYNILNIEGVVNNANTVINKFESDKYFAKMNVKSKQILVLILTQLIKLFISDDNKELLALNKENSHIFSFTQVKEKLII